MSRRHYDLPPFSSLSAFEAAARHLSFKNAAQELSVTPGAVSHQIKTLEDELGTPLFRRRHRGVELTSEGEALFETLSSAFGQISRQVARTRRAGDVDAVSVGSTTAVAALWLSPVIIDFWRDHPDINVHQVSQDRPFQNVQDFDFFICYGRAPNPSLTQTPVYRDALVPVAAPRVAEALGECDLEDLAAQRLIHLDARNPSWTTWSEWFGALGYAGNLARGTRVTSYSVALQIARQGAGIALGWRRLINPLIASGKLATIGSHTVPAPHQFYIAGLADADLSPGALALKTWLLENAHATSV